MGASDILKNSNTDLDEARYQRQNRLNPPEYAPMQGGADNMDDFFNDMSFNNGTGSQVGSPDPFNNTSDPFASSPSSFGGSTDSWTTGGTGGGFGTPVGGFSPSFGLQQPQTQQPQKDTEDKIFDGLATGAKASLGFAKEFVASFGKVTPKFWSSFGARSFVTGMILAVLGLVLMLFGIGIWLDLLVGSLLAAAVGVLVLMFSVDSAKGYEEKYKEETPEQPQQTEQPMQNAFDPFTQPSTEDEIDEYEESDDDYDDYDYDYEDDTTAEEDDEIDPFEQAIASGAVQVQAAMSTEEALESLPDTDKGVYTRQYLYEAFTKRLECYCPDYAKVKTIDENSDVFIQWEQYLRDAAEATGVREENLPTLLSLTENLFTVVLTSDRPIGMKHELVAAELSNIYAYIGGTFNESVYAVSYAVGKKCVFTVFTGQTGMISLKDMYNNCSNFILDTKNYMPVVLGCDPQGNVITCDFKKVESVLITGMPRSGKSWFVQDVLTQMCALVSPRELNLYICDPKDGISDYKNFCLPHVKKFVTNDDDIVAVLRKVVREDAPKRKKLIGDAGFVNIWDYKQRFPDVHLPVIYLVIDEVVTLAERMDKETKAEFQGLLTELISQLPALGIRAFLIPHVIKNDIIKKTTTDLIQCRISVCGDEAHIESSTGTKPRDFQHKLKCKGDMAVKIPIVSPQTMFVHASVLSDDNVKNQEIFDYLLRVWSRLEPEECQTDVVTEALADKENKDALSAMQSSALPDDEDLFGDSNYSAEQLKASRVSNKPLPRGTSNQSQNSGSSFEDNFDVFGDDDNLFN